ncbi:MAG: hypothetical protein GTO45_30495 [Candidatus Aminicenantes bacterium]|nr:hypothetical protein [Candidatus Aminicenantes bacterium]NIM83123.1 hypothetical protein [Candidatus Aminicenantes bacterium]NIN22502.1 hypothetical protein [Candidatus Aminicenantes bacterium]NIN46270.1 hypothetical protein [Candidatus Aminicenantes bacterium]NIN89108.1 hypothetical protein [Candidatus Aminicenantes bacterium]
MKVVTHISLLDINPADILSIKPASVIPERMEFSNLPYCVDFNDKSEPYGCNMACISESDALKLSELSKSKFREGKSKSLKV